MIHLSTRTIREEFMRESRLLKWRRLDNSAKIFPVISNKKFSSVFRISATLKEKIQPEILQHAVEVVLNYFISYKVKLKKGFFWYYLEHNPKNPIVEEENNYPCKYIEPVSNHDYLFKVTYYENKINLDMFHSLTDGNGATEFLRAILYRYLELAHPNQFPEKELNITENVDRKNTEDSYLKNYQKHLPRNRDDKKAYILKGEKLPLYAIGVTHDEIELKPVIKLCRKKGITLTEYFTAMIIYGIYHGNYKKHKGKKRIKICIPVNLKKYFYSTTTSNFFSYITVSIDMRKEKSFEEILEIVKEEFQKKLQKEEILKTMSQNVSLGVNFFVKIIPLILKNILIKLSYIEIRKYTTTTFSNIGKISVLPEYRPYIENFSILLAPEKAEKIKCSLCSYEDSLVFTFTSILADQEIEEKFLSPLKKEKIKIKTETNGVYYGKKERQYPLIGDRKKDNITIKILLGLSLLAIFTCVLIDFLTKPPFHWSILSIIGILYTWVTTLYSIKKNVNIASHVMLQTICTSLLLVIIDYTIGYRNWSITWGIPMIVTVANVTLTCLFIVMRKKYIKYIIYHLIILVVSIIPVILLFMGKLTSTIPTVISSITTIVTLTLIICFVGKEMKTEIVRRFHI